MKIPNEYPKFLEKRALIIVSGRENGKFYAASNGLITEMAEFGERVPKYSDREGFFMRLGGGKIFGSGSVYESKIKNVEKKFISDFAREFASAIKENDFSEIHIFAPNFMYAYLEGEIPEKYHDKIVYKFDGNYQKEHPLKLLEKIGGEIDKDHPGAVPVNKEARKILNRFKKINK